MTTSTAHPLPRRCPCCDNPTPVPRRCPCCDGLTPDRFDPDRDGACSACHAERCEMIDARLPGALDGEMADALAAVA